MLNEKIKRALVLEEFSNKAKYKVFYLLYGTNALKEKLEKDFPKGKKFSPKRFDHFSLTKEELISILLDWLEKGKWIDPQLKTIEDYVAQKGYYIEYVPAEEQTEELQLLAVQNGASLNQIESPSFSVIKKAIQKSTCFLSTFSLEMAKKLSVEELTELIRICPDIVISCASQIKELITRELFYVFLETMVTKNHSYILGYPNIIYPEYMDKFAYRCYCMVHGYNFSIIPDNLKEEYISEKLIHYCLDHATAYISPYHLLRAIPDCFKTEEICLKACHKHFSAVQFLPKRFQNDSFYQKLFSSGQEDFLTEIDMKTISLELFFHIAKTITHKNRIPAKIPKTYWNQELANTLSTRQDAMDIIPPKYITKDICTAFIQENPCYIESIPKKFLNEELCILAMEKSTLSYKFIPDEMKTSSFFCRLVENGTFSSEQVPEEYLTETSLIKAIQNGGYSKFSTLPPTLLTQAVCDTYIEKYPDIYVIPEKLQSNTLFQKRCKNIDNLWLLYNNIISFKSEYRSEKIINTLLCALPCAIELEDLTREQIDLSVDHFPQNILIAPDWYFETNITDLSKQTNQEFVLPYTQISLWDVFTA